ncbi:DUF6153 family protein [Streptomyces sp. AHA2]|uniref:DUF6153 family protein n=1 Tax=Streptomyces sp. AHA2 TaxID=3064526 RepID=UPI002FE380A0
MCGVNSPRPSAPRPAPPSWRVLAVLGLLAGLLGMHGLAPGGALPHRAPAAHATHDAVRTGPSGAVAGQAAADGHCGGGDVRHADATCASGALGGGPVLPALVPLPAPAAPDGSALPARAAGKPDGARGPPSLAELQLLRI